MQGKIALEEHFAIEATLGDSQVFGAHVWKDLSHRLLDIQDTRLARNGQARDRNDDPVAECAGDPGNPRRQDCDRGGEAGQRCAGRRSAQAARPFCRLRRAADAGPGSGSRRAHTLRQRARHGRRTGQRIFANRHAGQRHLLRSAAIPAVLARGRSARRSVLSASAQSAAKLDEILRGPQLAARAELGVCRGNRSACAAPDRQRLVRRMPATEDGARPYRRRHSRPSLAHRQSQRLDEGAA